MACASYPDSLSLTTAPRARRDRRLLSAVLAASAFALAYTAYLVFDVARAADHGGVALHVVGVTLALVASTGGWAAVQGQPWGLPLVEQGARGNLALLGAAIAFTAWDSWAGGGGACHEPFVALAALGAIQAATLLLARGARSPRVRA
jgi:hypothetical protein